MTPPQLYPKQSVYAPVYSHPLSLKNGFTLSFEIRPLETAAILLMQERSKSFTQDCYEIIWIKKGAANFEIDLQIQKVLADSIVLLSPGQHFRFEPVGVIEGYSIRFSQEFLCLTGRETSEFFHSAKLTCGTIFPAIQIDKSLQQDINLIVLNILREYSSYLKSRNEALQGLVKMLIIHLSRKFDCMVPPPVNSTTGELHKKFMLLVDKNFIKKKMVTDYASDLFVSPNYLNFVVKRSTGYSASYHIQQRIILEAKRFAMNPEFNMKEISFKLGYDDVAHFSKFFKINGGINFTDFRKMLVINNN